MAWPGAAGAGRQTGAGACTNWSTTRVGHTVAPIWCHRRIPPRTHHWVPMLVLGNAAGCWLDCGAFCLRGPCSRGSARAYIWPAGVGFSTERQQRASARQNPVSRWPTGGRLTTGAMLRSVRAWRRFLFARLPLGGIARRCLLPDLGLDLGLTVGGGFLLRVPANQVKLRPNLTQDKYS